MESGEISGMRGRGGHTSTTRLASMGLTGFADLAF
jgi:hypothetical protein